MQLALPTSLSDQRQALLTTAAQRLSVDFGPSLLGLVLSGSAGRGLATDRSDLDLLVILTPEIVNSPSSPRLHTPELEQIPLTLDRLETTAPFGDSQYAYRWSYAWAPVLADLTGGRVASAIERQTRLTPDEALQLMLQHDRLGGWLNLTFRALKSARDGQMLEAQLDAVEALPFFLDIVFGLEGLVRPYNKYLPWAIANHPLADWRADELLAVIEQMRHGSPDALRLGISKVHQVALRFADSQNNSEIPEAFAEWYPDDYGDVLGLPPGAG